MWQWVAVLLGLFSSPGIGILDALSSFFSAMWG